MAKTLQFRRDSTANLASVTGAVGEIFIDTTKKTVVVMDGSTAGGFPLELQGAGTGATGVQGASGSNGTSGATGSAGANGATGTAGATGIHDVYTYGYTFSSTTTEADPSSGNIRFDNGFGASTEIYISDLNSNGIDIGGLFDTFTQYGGATHYATMKISKIGAAQNYTLYDITAILDNTSWHKFDVTARASNGSISNSDPVYVQFQLAGHDGADGATGSQGVQGASGSTGLTGATGTAGATGNTGATGIQGEQGNFGGAAFEYVYDSSSTADSDPGTGKVKFSNTTFSSASFMYINETDFNSLAATSFLETIDDSTSNIKGHFSIADKTDPLVYSLFTITGAHTKSGSYYKIPVGYVSGDTTITDETNTILTFQRTGDKGDTGLTGATGVAGATGNTGATGIQGASGVGATGAQGIQGASGSTGPQGSQGVQGATGTAGSNGTNGATGSTGAQGASGVQGASGSTGTAGSNGATGTAGSNGATGATGTAGTNGATGTAGASGPGANQSLNTTSGVQYAVLGIGTATLGATGSIRATNDITAYYTSDRTLKENIQDIPNALDKVVAIGGKTFDWTDEYIASAGGEDGYFVNKSDFGVIAQDVQEAFPMAVRLRDTGKLAVDYDKLIALAFAAIKELKAQLDAK